MKLGIITDEVTQDIEKAVKFAKVHKLHGVELRSLEDTPIDLIPIKRIKEIRNILKCENLEVCNLSSSFFKCSIDSEEEYMENIEKLKRLMEIAHIFDCPYIRGFAFFKSGKFQDRLDDIVDKFQKPIDMLKSENIQLLLEADPGVFTTNNRGLSQVISKLNSKNIAAIYDPGNDIYDPEGEIPYPDGFQYIERYMAHVHIKDAKLIDGKPKSLKVGTGDVPYKDILKKLKEINYKGYIVLETHYRPNVEIPEELMRLPMGSLFSLNGDIASEESMHALKSLL